MYECFHPCRFAADILRIQPHSVLAHEVRSGLHGEGQPRAHVSQVEVSLSLPLIEFCENSRLSFLDRTTFFGCRYSGDPTVEGGSEVKSGYKIEDAQVIYSTHKVRMQRSRSEQDLFG